MRCPRALLAFALLSLLGFSPAPARAAAEPAITFGETRPLETTLGDPALPSAQSIWIDMIEHARTSVDLEEFYYSNRPGEALQPVIDELGRAAARGVRVRLMLDAHMSNTYPHATDSLAKLTHVEVRLIDYRVIAGGVQHAKFIVVDDRDGWLGSQNFDWRSLSHVHELGVHLRDPRLAGALAAIFATDWAAADPAHHEVAAPAKVASWPLRVPVAGGPPAEVWIGASPAKTNPAGIPWDLDLILRCIANAQHDLRVQVMTYSVTAHGSSDSTLQSALLAAAARGVHVRLLVADWEIGGPGEPALRELASHANVEVRISQVPEWSGGYIPFARVEHCKFLVADDDWTWIGTSNWEHSYFHDTRNVGLTAHSTALAAETRKVFDADWNAPTAVAYTADSHLTPRAHGETVPAGAHLYGE